MFKVVVRLLTVDQKQQRIDNSEHYLQQFKCNKKEFLHKYVTMEETWIHHFTPESNWQSAEWTAAGESCLKWPVMQTSAGKILVFVFWDPQGTFIIDYFEKGRTINSEYYIALLVHLKEEIKKQPQMKKKNVSQVDYNDGKTTWIALQIASAPTLLSRSGPQWLLAVCRPQKKCSRERDLVPMKKGYQKLRRILRPKTIHSTKKGIELLEKHWNQYITLEGDYVDE